MRSTHWLAFDEYIPSTTVSTTNVVYTGAQHNAALAKHDQLGVQVICDNMNTGNGVLELRVEESNDGRVWVERNGGTYDIQTAGMASATVVTKAWSDACQGSALSNGPLLGFVRFKMYFSLNHTAAHVKVYVTQRDP